jgi:hypothetical protein
MEQRDLLSVHDVAIRLSLSDETVVHLAEQQRLAADIIDGTYWFHEDDVQAYTNRYPDADPPGDGAVNDLSRSG